MLSVPHLIIIFLVALIVLGPEKLPEVARTISKAMIEFRSATSGLRDTLESEMRQLEQEINEKKGPSEAQGEPRGKPALTPMSDAAAEEPQEEAPEPGETGEAATMTDDSYLAGPVETTSPAEDSEPDHEAGADDSSDANPEKPTDGHPTAA